MEIAYWSDNFSNFVNFCPRMTIFTFLEFSAQAKREYDKKFLNNWTSVASIVQNDQDRMNNNYAIATGK